MQIKNGFTLIEFLTTIALMIIIAFISISMVQHTLKQNRLTNEVNQIVNAIHYARSEAIKQNAIIILCQSSDQKTCSGAWNQGQVVLIKNKVLQVFPALNNQDQLIWKSSLAQNDALQFNADGFTNGQQGSFYFCPTDKNYAKRIVVEQSGRVRVTDDGVVCG